MFIRAKRKDCSQVPDASCTTRWLSSIMLQKKYHLWGHPKPRRKVKTQRCCATLLASASEALVVYLSLCFCPAHGGAVLRVATHRLSWLLRRVNTCKYLGPSVVKL